MPDSHIAVNPPNPSLSPPVTPPRRSGLAVASLVLGITALFLSLAVIGLVVGIVSIVLAMIHISGKRGPTAMAWWGVVLSLVAIVASVGLGIVYFQSFKTIQTFFTSLQQQNGPVTSDASEWEGVIAPEISITTLDGQTLSLSQLKGKRVVVDFWATWCGPCVSEIPHFNRLYSETSRDELMIIGISQEDQGTVTSFAKRKGIKYPIASARGLPAPYGEVHSLPTTFFIDRNGVIQSVAVGARNFEELKTAALAKDFEGNPAGAPAGSAGLEDSETLLNPVELWSAGLAGVQAVSAGDWDQDGEVDILAADGSKKLHILGVDGKEKHALSLPDQFSTIELGRHKTKGVRLLAHVNWGREVVVIDAGGKVLWKYSGSMGINGAHWGDLDGDGTDEMIIGMNGFGGLHAVSADGKQIWSSASFGNIWNQAVIPAENNRPAMVFATEAGGSIQVLDAKGNRLRSLRPRGKYSTMMTAASMDSSNTVQIIAHGQDQTLVCDENGRVAFAAPAKTGTTQWQNPTFGSGDVNGDGVREWCFVDASGALVLATVEGKKLAALPPRPIQGFTVVPVREGRALVVVLQGGNLKAYSFQ